MKYLTDLVLGNPIAGTDVDGLATVVSKSLIPDCAMQVNRTKEGGDLSLYTPAAGACGCYFDGERARRLDELHDVHRQLHLRRRRLPSRLLRGKVMKRSTTLASFALLAITAVAAATMGGIAACSSDTPSEPAPDSGTTMMMMPPPGTDSGTTMMTTPDTDTGR